MVIACYCFNYDHDEGKGNMLHLSSPFLRLPHLFLSQIYNDLWSGIEKHQFFFKSANIKLKRKFQRGHRVIQVSHYLTAESHILIEIKNFL